jgi:hypothetical protein
LAGAAFLAGFAFALGLAFFARAFVLDIIRSPIRGAFLTATIAMRWDTVTSESKAQQLKSANIPADSECFAEIPHERCA